MGTDHRQPCQSTEASQAGSCGVPHQPFSWMMGAVHAVAAAISVVISVPAILLEGIVMLVVLVARPTEGVTLMAHGPVSDGDHNMGTAGMCTVWSSVDCSSLTFPTTSQSDVF